LSKCRSSLQAVCVESKDWCLILVNVYICGGSDGHIARSLESLNLVTNQWKSLERMKYKREEHGFTLGPDGKLYAIAGFSGKHCLGTAERYDIQKNRWEEITPLKTPRRSLSAVALPDGIYALGGYDGENYLSSVEKFDIEKNEWIMIQPLNYARCTMACVSSLDCNSIYVLGGYNGQPLNIVEKFDTLHNKWQVITPMKYKRFMHSAVVVSINSN